MQYLTEWALRWGIQADAFQELVLHMTGDPSSVVPHDLNSEAGVQSAIRLNASRNGCRLWRNNVGMLPDPNGRPVRFGLANESAKENKRVKSSDLIGLRPVTITREHVGHVIGQFVAIEVKAPGWKFTGKGREEAQARYIQIVNSLGGYGKFSNDPQEQVQNVQN